MTTFQIFGLQFAMSLVLYALLAAWYVAPRLARLPLAAALPPLLWLHAFRHLGLVFLVPTVVGPPLQPAFAVPAAYGDLLAALLALLAIVALRRGWAAAVALAWLFNVVGALDLLHALYQGTRWQVQLGSAYYIPTFAVPALLVTHAMIFARLARRAG
ncbi:MAG: hypothetical protein ACRELS_12570 [Candidatus Rokuibacteriota bacterium]